MTATRNLAEVKKIYGEKVVETATSFVVNDHGKYRPNISFVLPKDFSGDPLKYRSNAPSREMIAGMGLDLGTSEAGVSVLFGDFWSSKAGKPHFRPKSPAAATHVIVRAEWGGINYSRSRGRWDAPEGVTYFRHAPSNGGGMGRDFYVVTVGFYRVIRDEEIDGDVVVMPYFGARAKEVRAAFAAFDLQESDKAAAEEKAKAEAEAASRAAKAGFLPRLTELQARLERLRVNCPAVSFSELKLQAAYFVLGWGENLYSEANVENAELNVSNWEKEFGVE